MPQNIKEEPADKSLINQEYRISNFNIEQISYSFILRYSSDDFETSGRGFNTIQPDPIEINKAVFPYVSATSETVKLAVEDQDLILSCSCSHPPRSLCKHQAQVLLNLADRRELRIFFDPKLRQLEFKKIAPDYGLENEIDLDKYFLLDYHNKSFVVKPKIKELLPVNPESKAQLKDQLIPKRQFKIPGEAIESESVKKIVVLSKHRFYNHLFIEIFEASVTKEGSIKNPLNSIDPSEMIWQTDLPQELKFFSGISKFQSSHNDGKSGNSNIEGLRAIVKNPLNYQFFYHDSKVSTNISSSSIVPIKLQELVTDLRLFVNQKDQFFEISGELVVREKFYALDELTVRYGYFIFIDQTFFLTQDEDFIRVMEFFRRSSNLVIIHQSKFEEFRQDILAQLENKVKISYAYLKPATKRQLAEEGFDDENEKIIYLSDSADYVIINPVVRYGKVEIPVLTKKQIYSVDKKGKPFTVERNDALEIQFIASLLNQHPDFNDQLNLDYFYLHKNRFLGDDWFLEVFESWKKDGIKILGFNKITKNKLNQNKAKISVSVSSGLDWFDTRVKVKFGDLTVSLKNLHKSLRNKSRFVELSDGTQGILPDEWIKKLSDFFHAGEITDESIRTAKINFSAISELYEEEVLSEEVKREISLYRSKTSGFKEITEVAVPKGLKAELRHYQAEGLNWLNFLDEFNFGGCLADDMGLGKTVQIIAFLLLQKEKHGQVTNLVVVPTSLIFNWQNEVKKFAPSLSVLTVHGADRTKNKDLFAKFDIVLTTYGTLLTDINPIKTFPFNYIILDESQAIKNPESLRYKAVRLLQSRNKLVLTGTPLENNTFDLYGQFSFACPGLLGSKQHFKAHYSMPIDKFKDGKRAKELQQKINPFILRRTKAQVATELPDKTEMLIYCEMADEQKKIYDSYAKEYRDFLITKEEGDISRNSLHVLQGLTKLRQICDSPALLGDRQFYGSASSKIETLIEQIEGKSTQHKIIVFSQFVGMLDLIRKELQIRNIPFQYLTGQTTNRGDKVDDFQNNEQIKVFLISLKAGGTGLNLTSADYVYLVDPWWNPAVENQAIDRVYRIGQNKNVVAVRLICPDTIEEKLLKLQETKKDLASDLVKTENSILKSLTKKDLIELFS